MPVPVDPDHPDPELVARAARFLGQGDVIAGPSDTVYGLLALSGDPRALAMLRGLKGREGPFLLLAGGWEDVRRVTAGLNPSLEDRLRRVWPGPVTVILPAAAGLGTETVALRMPDSPLLAALLSAVGEPLLSSSANLPGAPAPVSADEVVHAFGDALPLVLDGGRARSDAPSTVVDCTRTPARIVRRGRGDPAPLLDPDPLHP